MVYQAEVVRFLLKSTPAHEGFAKRVFGNVQHLVPSEVHAAISKPADAKVDRIAAHKTRFCPSATVTRENHLQKIL